MEYKHVISLGHACAVAHELERLGYRDHSGPFDWQGSRSLKAKIELIQQDFKPFFDNLTLDTLYQRKVPFVYLMKPYSIYFVHDFNQYDSLESQLPAVIEKYKRRVANFYKDIKEPTLFVYYITNQEDADWISQNMDYVYSVIQSYNSSNDIIFIADRQIAFSQECYFVENDKDSDIAYDFVNQNKELVAFFDSLPFSEFQRNANIKHFQASAKRKKINSLLKRGGYFGINYFQRKSIITI